MIMIIVLPVILQIISFVIEGFCIQFWGQLISTIMFICRKWGIVVKPRTLFVIEGLATFVTQITGLLIKRWSIVDFILILLLRGIYVLYVIRFDETWKKVVITMTESELAQYDLEGK